MIILYLEFLKKKLYKIININKSIDDTQIKSDNVLIET